MVVLSVYGIHRYYLVYLYYRHKKHVPQPKEQFSDLPGVLVQLPIFNEALVVNRLIDSVCALDYPRDQLEIQVLDDSTDETCAVAEAKVAQKRAEGYNISRIHRTDRVGFKAGALAEGLRHSDKD